MFGVALPQHAYLCAQFICEDGTETDHAWREMHLYWAHEPHSGDFAQVLLAGPLEWAPISRAVNVPECDRRALRTVRAYP